MAYTTAHIKRYINSLDKGEIFSTRELLIYGSRTSVDQCLCRLVREEIIIRLARGLFMRQDFDVPMPTTYRIAFAKAKAFGKQIVHPDRQASDFIYLISGGSSAFRTANHELINFKAASPRKMYLGDNTVGLVIRTLWQLGKYICDKESLDIATTGFNRLERQQLRQSAHIIPSWLNSLINSF